MQLSVAISTDSTQRGLPRCLASIERQSLRVQLDLRVYTWSDFPDRSTAIANAKFNQVLLLDADCSLPGTEYFNALAAKVSLPSPVAVFGGGYKNLSAANAWDRAYNQLCNSWVDRGLQPTGGATNLLGGCLFILKDRLPAEIVWPGIPVWGGEDTILLRAFTRAGTKMQFARDLSVYHQADNGWRKTIRRGFAHGWHRSQFSLETQNPQRFKLPNLHHWPVWALHFSALEIGATLDAIYRKRPTSSPNP